MNYNYKKIAEAFVKFQTEEQRKQAEESFAEYLYEITLVDPKYSAEMVRRMNSEQDFREKMLLSYIQLSCLTTSAIDESIFVYDEVFPVVKNESKNDYDEIKSYKLYLLSTVSLEEIQNDLGFTFETEIVEQFEKRFSEIKNYFETY